jgi:glycine betaine catabolism B
MKLTLTNKKPITPDVTLFIFTPEEPINWKAGQFLRYQLPDPSPDERGESRFFTISSAPYEKNIFLATKFAPNEGSTFKKDLHNLPIGATIDSFGPSGSFTLNYPEEEYVFIAGGIGITPFRSIVMDLNHSGKPVNINLLYANRNMDIPFKEEFEEVKKAHPEFKIQYFIGDNKIDEQSIRKNVADLTKPIFYLSGPEPMVQSFEELLAKMGAPEDHIKRDYFPGYQNF